MGTHSITVPKSTLEKLQLRVENTSGDKRKSVSGTAWQLALDVLTAGKPLTTRDLSTSKSEREVLGIRVPARHESLLAGISREKGLNQGECLARAIITAVESSTSSSDPVREGPNYRDTANVLLKRVNIKGFKGRPEQVELIARGLQGHSKGKISLLEASTGSGKGLALVLLAVHAAESGRRCLVASPTLSVLRQLLSEYQTIEGAPAAQAVLGKQEYVSCARLKETMNSFPEDAQLAVDNWLKHQEKIDDVSERYQMHSLANVYHDLPTHTIRLSQYEYEEDPGLKSYEAQFDYANDCGIVFVTHAMLILDTVTRIRSTFSLTGDLKSKAQKLVSKYEKQHNQKLPVSLAYNILAIEKKEQLTGVLPGVFDALFIDEAHQLESIASSTLGDSVSVAGLRANINALDKSLGIKASAIKTHFNRLVDIGQNETSVALNTLKNAPVYEAVCKLLNSVENFRKQVLKHCKTKKLSSEDEWKLRQITEHAGIIRRALSLDLKPGAKVMSMITWTPVKDWPLISIDNENVFRELDFLWRSMGSVCMMSATLYLPEPTGAGYMQSVLSIPKDRIRTFPPIHTKWLKKGVSLHVPQYYINGGDRAWLMPANYMGEKSAGKNKEDTIWHDEVADIVFQVSEKAKGGVLVLVTSYHSSQMLKTRLDKTLGGRLVVQTNRHSLHYYTNQYKSLFESGIKPVWVALGAANTGLDLADKRDDIEDNMLSDLIIPRIPFGVNRSPSHRMRARRYFLMEASESAIALRQMVGRLKRQEQTGQKRLWVLDARIVSPETKVKTITMLHRKVIDGYDKKIIKKPS